MLRCERCQNPRRHGTFPDEIYARPEELVRKPIPNSFTQQQSRERWTLRRIEQPELFSEELRAAFRSLH